MSTAFSPVSWERMSNAIENVRHRLLRASAALEAAGIAYAVIGGNAVAAWVSRIDETAVRNTRDVDLLLRREDLPAATAALEAAGFQHRRVSSLGQAGAMDIFLDGPESRVRDAVRIVFAGERARSDQPAPNANVDESEFTGSFRLIALDALVRMKLTAFRDKDRMHIRDLLDVGLLDSSWLSNLPDVLRARLEEILATPEG
jgi:hypothetical protein